MTVMGRNKKRKSESHPCPDSVNSAGKKRKFNHNNINVDKTCQSDNTGGKSSATVEVKCDNSSGLKTNYQKKAQKVVSTKVGKLIHRKNNKQKVDKKKENFKKRQRARLKKQAKKEEFEKNVSGGTQVQSTSIDSNWQNLLKTLEKPAHSTQPKKQKPLPTKTDRKTKAEESKEEDEVQADEPDIWFDDVDELLIDRPVKKKAEVIAPGGQAEEPAEKNPLVKPQSYDGVTRVVAMDCEMVGVGADGKESILARASIVNQFGRCIYDKYVKPSETVTDYRTHVSGIKPEHLKDGLAFDVVCKEIYAIIKGRMLVGHAIHNDLKVLFLDHPHKLVRDTQLYKPFRQLFKGRRPALKKLTERVLGVKVQQGQHDSVQDAQAAMRLYTMHRQAWEKDIKQRRKKPNKMAAVVNINATDT